MRSAERPCRCRLDLTALALVLLEFVWSASASEGCVECAPTRPLRLLRAQDGLDDPWTAQLAALAASISQ
jgi:hypothetical protein